MEEEEDLLDHFVKFETVIRELRERRESLNNTEEVRYLFKLSIINTAKIVR